MALALFGCWVHIAKDSADVRYLILSSLRSMDILEAKASLFAAGCFSELADDFAYVILEMLGGLLMSSETSRAIRLAGGRAFVKMWCSILLADRSHKIGIKLILESSEEDFSLVMLILPPSLDTIPCTEIPTIFSKFVEIVEFKIQSPIISERLFAVHILASIFDKLSGILKDSASGNGSIVASHMITFTISRISQLIKLVVDNPHPDKEVEQEIKSLLLILVNLVERHRYLSGIVLDKIYIVVEQLVSLLNELTGMTNSGSDDHHIKELDKENRTSTASRVLLYLSQILITFFEMLDVSTAGSTQLFNRMEHLVDHMHLSVYVAGDDMVSNRNFRLSHCSSLSRVSCDGSLSQHEIFIIDRAKQILDKRDYWLSYKLAKYAACHGAWLVAAYVFGKLRSDNCCFWLKSLSHLSELERQVQLLGLTLSGNTVGKIATINHVENVVGASNKLCSLEKAFDASVSGLAFSFQRWFITLRSKVVETVADHLESSQGLSSMLQLLANASSQFMRLVKEFELLATSFIDMYRKSMKIVSDLGLSCSLLAFSTGLTFCFASSHGKQDCRIYGLETSEEEFQTLLVHDLLRRLGYIDLETSKNLRQLLNFRQSSRSCSMQEIQNEILKQEMLLNFVDILFRDFLVCKQVLCITTLIVSGGMGTYRNRSFEIIVDFSVKTSFDLFGSKCNASRV
ncbi:hypothetical protein RND71_019569 [Anisodus tanguticus]|uniref:Uncharacterized protein n=1 Tax=Anisodus tanguticus TaxID=243964 RepID=A0AAE1S0R5_9SOLA|nr:hypothetical protein RND71_019569 [Anisodus tanguticus]